MSKKTKYILIGGVIFLFIIILGSGGSKSDSNTSTKPVVTQTEAPVETISVDLPAFVKEFDENQLSAEDKYKGKTVSFTGYIANISEDILGSPFLSVNPTSEEHYFGTHLQCMFKDKSDLISLKNGEKVNLSGKVKAQTLGIITVENCKLTAK